jgi:predicted glycosyltransferase
MPPNSKMERLDLLIYAHDGRGLGHASRSAAIGLAVRRLFPELRTLFVTGMPKTADLIGEGKLDWIKLPSYETRVVDGVSRGCRGFSNFSDRELGTLRAGILRDLVVRLHPRCVLSDHMPQGKHRELLPALTASASDGATRWMLGLRGVIGNVKGVWSETATETVHKFYTDILWYGDPVVLGDDMAEQIAAQFGRIPTATGYVSRLAEWCQVNPSPQPTHAPLLAGTVSMPWIGEHSAGFLEALVIAIERIGSAVGHWHFFLGRSGASVAMNKVVDKLRGLPYCRVFDPGEAYLHALMRSRMAVVYGGYNSLTDLLYLRRPGLVVLRGMHDQEQQIHVRRLRTLLADQLQTVNETEASPDNVEILLRRQLASSSQTPPGIKMDGAQTAAHYIGQSIEGGGRG